MTSHKSIGLIGFANCGKTTLSNKLTGQTKTTGNWTGVTVGQSSGKFIAENQEFELIDLPGLSNLASLKQQGKDIEITQHFLANNKPDCIVNVVDATQLTRQLFLTSQLFELNLPVVLILTKTDRKTAAKIDVEELSKTLNCPVLVSSTKKSVTKEQLAKAVQQAKPASPFVQLTVELEQSSKNELQLGIAENKCVDEQGCRCQKASLSVMQQRHKVIRQLCQQISVEQGTTENISDKLDGVLLHPAFGIPFFLLAMYLLFMFAINVGSAFIDFFDILAGGLFVDLPAVWLSTLSLPAWLLTIIEGVGLGIQTVATFIPVIVCLFIGLSLLESSGYLARAAFVIDSLMQKVGLPGKAFVPLIVGFGCTVPAVMSTRVLDSERERITTVMMSPFMSCGARLPVYALFAAAFFPDSGQNIVFLLYLIGIVAAIATGFLLKATVLPGSSSTSIMELPLYEMPTITHLLKRVKQRTKSFVLGAGQTIVLVVCVLNFFNSLGTDGEFGHQDTDSSILSASAQVITPVLAPLGVKEENWQAGVGIITGIFAKEALVATFNSLYSQVEDEQSDEITIFSLWQDAANSIPFNLGEISPDDPLGVDVGDISTLESAAQEQEVEIATYHAMQQAFDGKLGAFAYLLFILLYTPCAAAMGAISSEVGRVWASFAALWSFGLAYVTATLCYQIGMLAVTPVLSTTIILLCVLALFATYLWLKRKSHKVLTIPVEVSYH